ncbi:rhomboid family intramembrane serine protease [Chitinispirillales bacterium ANBcel5]|uniref:rhomboid family intramembrane serine protease n=1 Tax=Cellulosispirillum alkaliphilum TaxID=3039283 RepID=UPI002A55F88E|nr:rhomboid family intramembrane serine protease [Chitinispirillales bacterium ANBcel5]
MFPLRDENPTFRTSMITFIIIALNVVVWVFFQGMGSEPALSRSVCEFGAIPGELLGTVQEGTRVPISRNAMCVIGESKWITLFTSMFLHGGWLHLIGNMWFLYVFGDNIEDSMGRVRFLFFYLLCGFAASLLQIFTHIESPVPMVGASGAISGVMGAYAVLYPKAPVHMLVFLGFFITKIKIPAYLLLGYWFIIQFLSALPALSGDGGGGGVAFWAHVGGFVSGLGLIFLFRNKDIVHLHREAVEKRWDWNQS